MPVSVCLSLLQCSRLNVPKTLSWYSRAMPIPLSATEKRQEEP
jgi:hypothetical protein